MPRPPLSSLKMSIPWEKVTFECFSSWSRGCKVHICVSTSWKVFSVWCSQSPTLSWTTNDKRSNIEFSKVHLCWRLSRGVLFLLSLSESSVQVVSLVSSAQHCKDCPYSHRSAVHHRKAPLSKCELACCVSPSPNTAAAIFLSLAGWVSHLTSVEVAPMLIVVANSQTLHMLTTKNIFFSKYVCFPIYLLVAVEGQSTFWKLPLPPLYVLTQCWKAPTFSPPPHEKKGSWNTSVSKRLCHSCTSFSCWEFCSNSCQEHSIWWTRKTPLCLRPFALPCPGLHWKPIHQCRNIFKGLERVWAAQGLPQIIPTQHSCPSALLGSLWAEVEWRPRVGLRWAWQGLAMDSNPFRLASLTSTNDDPKSQSWNGWMICQRINGWNIRGMEPTKLRPTTRL